MKGRKCSIIFMRKVANRLEVLEERYKDLSPKLRAGKINEQLLSEFCVGRSEMFKWKQAVKIMEKSKNVSLINETEDVIQPTHAMEIARLPEEKQEEAIQKVQKENLTVKQTELLVKEVLGELKKPEPIPENEYDDVTLLHGDFREVGKQIPDNSVHCIIVDPPYGKPYLELWSALGELAKRVLVPSGFLISYSGQLYLPEVFSSLSKFLEYYWTACLTLQHRNLVDVRNVYNLWKPLLIWNKPPRMAPSKYFTDLINGAGKEKDFHDWQQGLAELETLIATFCPENGVILDPMAGSGTTLVAARKAKRKVIGIELSEETFSIMKRRLGYDNQ